MNALRAVRMGINTHQEAVVYMRDDCAVCRSEGFNSHSRVLVECGDKSVISTLNVIHAKWLKADEAGFSEAAWNRLALKAGAAVTLKYAPVLDSMKPLRAKLYGHPFSDGNLRAIIGDIAAGRYSDIQLAAFVASCSGDKMTQLEATALTKAMIGVGERLTWDRRVVVDKHCVGGLPGNRTTPIVVSIVTELGLTMPKTSSRAITSPAGTADTMETLAPVSLSLADMRRVVEREGGCVVWGGSVQLSPADDVLIRVERALDVDSEAQLVASVLSKKAAAGSTHVVIELPVGPTAKVRSLAEAESLGKVLTEVGHAVGLLVKPVVSDGSAPVGRGIGPALEAHDVLAVLRNEPGAPSDLRAHALRLAAEIVELAGRASPGEGMELVSTALASGAALKKFLAICAAQGGARVPGVARLKHPILAASSGRIREIDNRRLARAAKLAGAPAVAEAGIHLEAAPGQHVEAGQPLFTLHAATRGELDYALGYVAQNPDIFALEAD